MMNTNMNRRRFLKSSAGLAAGAMLLPSCSTNTVKTASDQVLLGNTGLTISRLGIGCGCHSGREVRDMGTDGFNRLVHYAYERGITYLDTANGYRTHSFVKDAIKDLPRDKFFILTKMNGQPEDPMKEIDRYRQELGTDYLDCVLIHCKIHQNWHESHKYMMDALAEAKEKGIIKSHGVSCHSLPATQTAAQLEWVDVNLVRVNPQGSHLDTMEETWNAESDVSHLPPVLQELATMRKNGHGIIGMKIIGEGNFTDPADRKKSIAFAMQPGLVDAVTIGFKSIAELDEAITNMNEALASSST
jgi:predicted aldo/keto reductase-like oxidoreductase